MTAKLTDGVDQAISRHQGTRAEKPPCCEGKVLLAPSPKVAYTCVYLSGKTFFSLCPQRALAEKS